MLAKFVLQMPLEAESSVAVQRHEGPPFSGQLNHFGVRNNLCQGLQEADDQI